MEGDIKMNLKGLWCDDVEWTRLDQDKEKRRTLVNTVMNLRFPQNAGNFPE